MIKTAFFASDPIALESIKFLFSSKEYPLVCVVSNPDKPKGRGNKVSPNEVSAWAIENNVALLRPDKSPDAATVARLRELGVELVVVMAYGRMLRENILNYGKYPCLNLHASVLPHLRGASPIESAIALRDKETGVSLMKIEPAMDTGPVCAVGKVLINARETSQTLREKIGMLAAKVLNDNIADVCSGKANFVEQQHFLATYARKFDKSDAQIDFSLCAEDIDARIRAFGFGTFEYNGEIFKAKDCLAFVGTSESGVCGKVLKASVSDGLRVSCAGGAVRFDSLQAPCAKMMCAKEFFLAKKIEEGFILKFSSAKKILRD